MELPLPLLCTLDFAIKHLKLCRKPIACDFFTCCLSQTFHSTWCGHHILILLFTSLTGVESLKQATRRYARKQNKWVRNRFLKSKSH